MAALFFLFLSIQVLNSKEYTINLNKRDRLFDGIGALSAGASSRLLIDYPEPQRSQILDYLFLPNFGASLQILKVEIGGDTWSTCGTEPSHMHTPNDIHFKRGYEFWLMTEAKKRNPLIKLYALSWGFPAWIGSGALNENMANYTVLWAKGAMQTYNLSMDYIGIWNEDNWSVPYVKLLRRTLNENGFNQTKIVVADMWLSTSESIISAMQNDAEFADSFDIIGVHYPTASMDTIAMAQSGKTLWSSEESSTNDDMIGGGCWARLLNWNYIYGNYTSSIMWSLISSWYEYLPYFGDGLMNAAWPWNGYYEVMSPLWITAHTTQFVDVLSNKWFYIKQGYGSGKLINGGTFVTFISEQNGQLDISIVIETMQYQHSLCIRNNPANDWNVSTQNITFQLIKNAYILPSILYVWKSELFSSPNADLFQEQEPIKIDSDLSFFVNNIVPNSVITLSSKSNGHKGAHPMPPKKIKFPLPYNDNFESYANAIKNGYEPQPKYFSDQSGSFAVRDFEQTQNYVLEQMVLVSPSDNGTAWNGVNAPQPLTIIGDYNMSDYALNVSAYMASNDNALLSSWHTSNIMIALRMGGTLCKQGCKGAQREYPCVEAMGANWFNYGYLLQIDDNGYWKLMPGAMNKILIDGNLKMDLKQTWFTLSFGVKEYALSATLNNELLFEGVIDSKELYQSGWAGLSCGWQTCMFDNFTLF